MSLSTLTPPADDFDGFEFAAIVAGFHTQPLGEPGPDEAERRTFRPSKAAVRREGQAVIDRELGIRRHRTSEREA